MAVAAGTRPSQAAHHPPLASARPGGGATCLRAPRQAQRIGVWGGGVVAPLGQVPQSAHRAVAHPHLAAGGQRMTVAHAGLVVVVVGGVAPHAAALRSCPAGLPLGWVTRTSGVAGATVVAGAGRPGRMTGTTGGVGTGSGAAGGTTGVVGVVVGVTLTGNMTPPGCMMARREVVVRPMLVVCRAPRHPPLRARP